VAKQLNRRFIGIEKDKDFYRMALKAISEVQGDLLEYGT